MMDGKFLFLLYIVYAILLLCCMLYIFRSVLWIACSWFLIHLLRGTHWFEELCCLMLQLISLNLIVIPDPDLFNRSPFIAAYCYWNINIEFASTGTH